MFSKNKLKLIKSKKKECINALLHIKLMFVFLNTFYNLIECATRLHGFISQLSSWKIIPTNIY